MENLVTSSVEVADFNQLNIPRVTLGHHFKNARKQRGPAPSRDVIIIPGHVMEAESHSFL